MDREEAHELAKNELMTIVCDGYAVASEHIDTAALRNVSSPAGTDYEIELSYHWQGAEHEGILVICRVCSKKWFTHEHIEESVTLLIGESR